MSSLPPANVQPPPRKKEPWRLRGVTRAQPHLGEGKQLALIAWLGLGGAVILVILIAGFFLFQTGSAVSVATAIPTVTIIRATLLPPLSPTTVSPSATRLLTPTRAPSPTTAPATVTPTMKPTSAQIKYRVRFGDTLSSIAAKYHVSIQSIMLANRLRSDIIFEGQELIIPVATPHP